MSALPAFSRWRSRPSRTQRERIRSAAVPRGRLVPRLVQDAAGQREGGDRERGPVGQQLVVGPGRDAFGPRGVETGAALPEDALDVLLGPAELLRELGDGADDGEHGLAARLEVPGLRHPEARGQNRSIPLGVAEGLGERSRIPDVEGAFLAAGVGVLRGEESSARRSHLGEQIVERLAGHAGVVGPLERAIRQGVNPREHGVVVEHLLEVRHEPAGVDGVAVKAAADLVVHSPRRHPVERRLDHPARLRVAGAQPAAEEQLEAHRGGKFRRAAEAALDRVELAGDRRMGALEDGRQRSSGPGRPRDRGAGLEVVEHFPGRALELVAARFPGFGDRREDLEEPGPSPARGRREVRPAIERLSLRREKEREGPAAAAGHHLNGLHVDVVDVGPLLAVDLDRDEVPVQRFGDALRLERLVLHDVAPVAGRVADREKDRLVLRARPSERLRSPGIPVHGVVLVLEEVRRGLEREAVGHPGRISPHEGGARGRA